MNDITKLIGECTAYDKKEALEEKKPRSWLKSVSAYANGEGGTLIFGVADNDEIVGLADAKGDSEKISQAIRQRMDPVPDVTLKFDKVDGKRLVLLEVKSGKQTPYYYIGDGNRIAYIRLGNESIPATNNHLFQLMLNGSGHTYDSLPSDFDFGKMAFTKLRSVYNYRVHKDFLPSDFESWGLVDSAGRLTNAGALMADESPVRHSRVFCTRWSGLDKAGGLIDAIDDAEFSGSLISQLQDTLGFIAKHTRKAWKKMPTYRQEFPDYPERSLQETLVNSLIHRDYTELGSEVHVDIFDDRIEVYSPGGMFDGKPVQEHDIMEVPSRRRNPILADIFNRLEYMERRGSGFKKIMRDYAAFDEFTNGLRPKLRSDHASFFITLWNINYFIGNISIESTDQKTDQKFDQKTDIKPIQTDTKPIQTDTKEGQKAAIIKMIETTPGISMDEISSVLSITKSSVQRRLEALVREGRLRHIGPTNGGHWEIIEE